MDTGSKDWRISGSLLRLREVWGLARAGGSKKHLQCEPYMEKVPTGATGNYESVFFLGRGEIGGKTKLGRLQNFPQMFESLII